MPSAAPTVFISYSHADETWKDRLVLQLGVLGDVLDVWDDRRITVGDDWRSEIESAMERARIAVFLVSPRFLSSGFILEKEVPRFLKRRKEDGLRIVPVIVDPCLWQRVPWLESLQGRPLDGKALSLMSRPKAEDALTEIAGEIFDLFAGREQQSEIERTTAQPRVAISRLPIPGEHFVGRDDELTRLDDAWAKGTNVISFVAFGGVGKSALVNRWLDRLGADGWRGAERVLGWSFYSQGTDTTAASGDAFVDYALEWFGYEGEPITSPRKKGEVLAEHVRAARTLLVLDGLEPLQDPSGTPVGRIKDPAVASLVRALAVQNSGLCVVTTRLQVGDVVGRAGATSVGLEELPKEAGAELLKKVGVKGSEKELQKASDEFGGHGLALSLLGTVSNLVPPFKKGGLGGISSEADQRASDSPELGSVHREKSPLSPPFLKGGRPEGAKRYREACEEVRDRANQTLEWGSAGWYSLLDIGLDHLTLGRAHLGLALTSEASPDFKEAEEHLDRAVEVLRRAGQDQEIPRGLLARATLRRFRGSADAGFPDDAASDLREAQEIAERGHMRLHEADVHLEWTRLFLRLGKKEDARRHFERARELVASTGYGRRDREVAWLVAEAKTRVNK